MINLLYVMPTHKTISSFAGCAIPDAFAIERVATLAKTQTDYHSVVVVNEYYFIAFRAAIARGDILAENIRMTVAHDGHKETRCVFNQSGMALQESDNKPYPVPSHDVFDDLLVELARISMARSKARREEVYETSLQKAKAESLARKSSKKEKN